MPFSVINGKLLIKNKPFLLTQKIFSLLFPIYMDVYLYIHINWDTFSVASNTKVRIRKTPCKKCPARGKFEFKSITLGITLSIILLDLQA